MKVFISSVIRDFAAYRDAAARAARTLRHEVTRAEDYGASSDSPQQVCLDGVRAADVTILLLGASYGSAAGDGPSPTLEEYREAREKGDVLVFVQTGVTREPRQEQFVAEVRQWAGGQFTGSFSSPEELQEQVTRALHELELSRNAGAVDEGEMMKRAETLLPENRHSTSAPKLCTIVVGAPRQQILRPAALEAPELLEQILQAATFGKYRVFDRKQGSEDAIEEHSLVLTQEHASIRLTPLGDIRIIQPLHSPEHDSRDYFMGIVEEDVQNALMTSLQFCAELLESIDPTRRLRSVAPLVGILDAGYAGWTTKSERSNRRGSQTMRMGNSDEVATAVLNPPTRGRPALQLQAQGIAEDLTVLLKRQIRA